MASDRYSAQLLDRKLGIEGAPGRYTKKIACESISRNIPSKRGDVFPLTAAVSMIDVYEEAPLIGLICPHDVREVKKSVSRIASVLCPPRLLDLYN